MPPKPTKILARLERVEKELEELKHALQPVERGSADTAQVGQEVNTLLKKRMGNWERIILFNTLQKDPSQPSGWEEASISSGYKGTMKIDIAKTSNLMMSCSNETRLRILHEIYKSPRYPKEITGITGLSGGALYHHIDVLTEAGLITRDKLGKIARTTNGRLFTDLVFHIIAQIAQGPTTEPNESPEVHGTEDVAAEGRHEEQSKESEGGRKGNHSSGK